MVDDKEDDMSDLNTEGAEIKDISGAESNGLDNVLKELADMDDSANDDKVLGDSLLEDEIEDFADLDIPAEVVGADHETTKVVEEPSDDGEDIDELEVSDDLVGSVDASILRQDSYADQATESTAADIGPEPGEAKAVSVRSKAGGGRSKGVNIEDVPAEFFFFGEDDIKDFDSVALESIKKTTIASLPKQVKVAEKATGAIIAMSAGKLPSKYLVQAFKLLDYHESVTVGDINAAFKSSGLSDGTAASQAGQMKVLLPFLGLATRFATTLTATPNNHAYKALKKIIDAHGA